MFCRWRAHFQLPRRQIKVLWPGAGPASQDVEGRFVELERNTLEAMMRATDQKSTQQPGEISPPSAGQSL